MELLGGEELIREPALETDVTRAARGDRAAFGRLYDAHVDGVFGFCLRFSGGDRAVAADLAQESFTAAFAHLASLREPARFSGWLRVITRRTCLGWASGRRRERDALRVLGTEPRGAPDPREHRSAVVGEVVAACPDPALREVAVLFYTEPGHDTGAIAERLGLSTTAVTTRLYRFRTWARRRMLARLADAFEEDG